MIQEINLEPKPLENYKDIINQDTYDEIEELTKDFTGLRVVHLNSSATGGGVAEILRSLIPMLKGVGLDANWYFGSESSDFFAVTKQMHHFLQGKEGDLTKKDKDLYLKTNEKLAKHLAALKADVWVIHDQQFVAVNEFFADLHPSVWRSHTDTSSPNLSIWNFILPYIKRYDRYIFTMRKYLGPGLDYDKSLIIPPAIDPLNEKNNPLPLEAAKHIISHFGLDSDKPLVSQISRFDIWKDPWGVIDAYRLSRERIPNLQLAYIGSFAPDDADGHQVLNDIRNYAMDDKDVFILSNMDGVDAIGVNAFQVASDVIIQKSTREGFGMTVSESMWKGKPVIGGKVGGIVEQIVNGETGFLVTTAAETAEKIVYLLKNKEKAKKMGVAGKERVREKFLMTRLLLDHLKLYKELVK